MFNTDLQIYKIIENEMTTDENIWKYVIKQKRQATPVLIIKYFSISTIVVGSASLLYTVQL